MITKEYAQKYLNELKDLEEQTYFRIYLLDV